METVFMALQKLTTDAEIHRDICFQVYIVNIMCSLPHNVIDSDVLAIVDGLVPFQMKKKKSGVSPIVHFFCYV